MVEDVAPDEVHKDGLLAWHEPGISLPVEEAWVLVRLAVVEGDDVGRHVAARAGAVEVAAGAVLIVRLRVVVPVPTRAARRCRRPRAWPEFFRRGR